MSVDRSYRASAKEMLSMAPGRKAVEELVWAAGMLAWELGDARSRKIVREMRARVDEALASSTPAEPVGDDPPIVVREAHPGIWEARHGHTSNLGLSPSSAVRGLEGLTVAQPPAPTGESGERIDGDSGEVAKGVGSPGPTDVTGSVGELPGDGPAPNAGGEDRLADRVFQQVLADTKDDRRPFDGPHPHADSYGPCDGWGVGDTCSECNRLHWLLHDYVESLRAALADAEDREMDAFEAGWNGGRDEPDNAAAMNERWERHRSESDSKRRGEGS